MVEILTGNAILIITLAYVLLVGIGIGAAITDAINKKGGRDEIQNTERKQ